MNKIQKCLDILMRIKNSPENAEELISQFQQIVWNDETSIDGTVGQILINLAHDLDYYEPDVVKREAMDEYFDDSRMLMEVNTAIYKIKIAHHS